MSKQMLRANLPKNASTSSWENRTAVTLSVDVLNPEQYGGVICGKGVAKVAQLAVQSPLPCNAQHKHTLRGSTPCNSDSDSETESRSSGKEMCAVRRMQRPCRNSQPCTQHGQRGTAADCDCDGH
eukprot:331030-Chlamydomonas_euryale.AAC.2